MVLAPVFPIRSLGLALIAGAMAACCPPVKPPMLPPGQLGESPTLSGKADNWIGKALSIRLELRKNSGSGSTLELLSSGTIDAAGSFSMKLPGLAEMASFVYTAKDFFPVSRCSSTDITPDDVKISYAPRLAVLDGPTLIGYISLGPDGFSNLTTPKQVFAALLFFDKAADLNTTCGENGFSNHLHATAGLGWNIDVNELYAPNLAHEYIGAMPKTIRWVYAPAVS